MAPHGGLPKLVFCSHTRGQYTPPCVLVVYLAHLTHRTTPGRGCCSRHSPGSQGCERLKSMPRATMGHLLALSVPKSCCNTMPQPESSKPNRHLEHFLWMQRGETLRTSYTQASGWGRCTAPTPTSAVKCFQPQVPTVIFTKPRAGGRGTPCSV